MRLPLADRGGASAFVWRPELSLHRTKIHERVTEELFLLLGLDVFISDLPFLVLYSASVQLELEGDAQLSASRKTTFTPSSRLRGTDPPRSAFSRTPPRPFPEGISRSLDGCRPFRRTATYLPSRWAFLQTIP